MSHEPLPTPSLAEPPAVDADPRPARAAAGKHLLTVVLEDYFHVAAFEEVIRRDQWYRFQTRLEQNTLRTLELLASHDAKATFFVLGWVADRHPELVAEIARRGHEIAASGYNHRRLSELDADLLREEVCRARDALERATGRQVFGFRSPHGWVGPHQMWVLDVLAEEGFAYDSSLLPAWRAFHGEPRRAFIHRHRWTGGYLWEVPPATAALGPVRVPIAGGNYFRQFPHSWIKRKLERWDREFDDPFVIYFHVWELDADQPLVAAASTWSRLRHYRNLRKMSWVLNEHLSHFRFGTIAEHLGLVAGPAVPRAREDRGLRIFAGHESAAPDHPAAERAGAVPITIVVPCYNESSTVPYLANTLASVVSDFAGQYEVHYVLVDDGSSDDTFAQLELRFAGDPRVRLVRHPQNRGVAAAILTGLRAAETEIVCSMDSDCSYDPHELRHMIPLLGDDVDLVTASPYHPEGRVRNVPGWRLLLSKGASWLYRLVLRQSIHTYTSCFRVYRRSAVADVELQEQGFLGVAELVARLVRRGSRIAEHPAVLETRVFGQSKMKVARTIVGHLRLLARALRADFDSSTGPRPAAPPQTSTCIAQAPQAPRSNDH